MGHVLKLVPNQAPDRSESAGDGEPAQDDASLVERAAEGAGWAQAELFHRHAPRVMAMLNRLLASTSDADDAAQDTFLEAFRDLSRLRAPGDFGRWVTRIAIHQAHRRFRRRRLLGVLGLGGGGLDAGLDQLADERVSSERRAELALVQKALLKLPADERLAWLLRFVEGYELTEVAASMDVSLATVKRKLTAAQATISLALGQEVRDEL